MKIKKREVIVSIAIVAILLSIGFIISDAIRQKQLEKCQRYETAVRIETKEEFLYGMSTDIGYALVQGSLEALDPVTYPNVKGQYAYITKRTEVYTRHERRNEDDEIEYYYTWDTVSSDRKEATRISFLGVEFPYSKIKFPASRQIDIVNVGYNRREVYSGCDANFQGILFAYLSQNTVSDTCFYNDQSALQVIESQQSSVGIIVFWVFWVILIAIAVFVFFYLDNRWLD